VAHVRSVFRESDWQHWRAVNQHFADAVVAEARPADPHALAAMDQLRDLMDAPSQRCRRPARAPRTRACRWRCTAGRPPTARKHRPPSTTHWPPSTRPWSASAASAVNVVPAGVPDKGEAVTALQQRSGAGAVVFIGDDVNDESVFRRAGAHWWTLRIGREIPQSGARFFLDSLAEVATLQQEAIDRLMARG
jgi:hypothetical protein